MDANYIKVNGKWVRKNQTPEARVAAEQAAGERWYGQHEQFVVNAAAGKKLRKSRRANRKSRRAERKSRKAERKSRRAERKSRRASRKSRRAGRR